jgi:tetratricopeptide (TPR) repeat protein
MARLPQVSLAVLAVLAASCGARDPLDTTAATRDLDMGSPTAGRYGAFGAYEHLVRGKILADRGDLEGAAGQLRIAVVADPGDFLLRAEYADVLAAQGEFARARRQLGRAILLEPTAQIAWVVLARTYLLEGRDAEAVDAARQGVRAEPGDPGAALWLASFHREKGDLDAAAELWGRVLRDHPRNIEALLGLGLASAALGNHARARECLEAYLRTGGGDFEAAATLARERVASGDPGGGIDLLGLAVARGADPSLRAELIELLLDEGQRSSALMHVRSLPTLAPDDAEGAIRRARWLERAGRPYEARELLIAAGAPDPERQDLTLALVGIEIALRRLEVAGALLSAGPEWEPRFAGAAAELERTVSKGLGEERTVR